MPHFLAHRRSPLSGFYALRDLANGTPRVPHRSLPTQLSAHLRRDIGLPELEPAPHVHFIRWR